MTRLAITSDLHVDAYFGAIDPRTGTTAREDDFLGMASWVADKARAFECEALVVAGDYVEAKRVPPVDRVDRIRDALEAGPDRQIHVRGNHDIGRGREGTVMSLARHRGWSGYLEPDFELVGDLAVCAIPHLTPAWLRTQPGMQLLPDAGIYSVLREYYLTIARGLYVDAMQAGARSAILVGHQQLAGGRMTEQQASFLGDLDVVVDSRALASIGFAAVTFGHVHWGQTVIDDPACPVAYIGAPERVDAAEEDQQKSFLVVDVVDGRATIERIPTPARRYLTLRGDGAFNPAAAEDAIVRGIDLDPDVDTGDLRRELERAGAFWIAGIRTRPVEATAATGGMDESLAPEQLLEAYFADDPDRDALVAMGRRLLSEVA
jgi:hypothetical protein